MSGKRPVVVYGASGFSGPAGRRVPARVQRPVHRRRARPREDRGRRSRTCPASSTADYEIVEVGARGRRARRALRGREGRLQHGRTVLYYGSTVAEAALKAGCHYIDTGGETPWVRLASRRMGREVRRARPAARAGDGVHVGDRRDLRAHRDRACARHRLARDPLDVQGLPVVRLDADGLRAARMGVDLPRAERVPRMAAR